MEVQQFADPDSTADLLLPAPSYLEIEGTALATNCAITRFRNPAKSALISELLRLFYELGWISPATADITHWNAAAEDLIKTGFSAQEQSFQPDLVDIGSLRSNVLPVDSLLQKRIIALYEQRQEPTQF